MAIYRLQRMPVTYKFGPVFEKIITRDYLFPVPMGRKGISSGLVIYPVVSNSNSLRYFYREDADSYELDITEGALRAYEMADVLSMHPDAAAEYTLWMLGEEEPKWPTGKDGIWSEDQNKKGVFYDLGKESGTITLPNFPSLQQAPKPTSDKQKVLDEMLAELLKDPILNQAIGYKGASVKKHLDPNGHTYFTVPAGMDLKTGDLVSIESKGLAGDLPYDFSSLAVVKAGQSAGKSSIALAMLGEKLKAELGKIDTNKSIAMDNIDFEALELKTLASMASYHQKKLYKNLEYAFLYGTQMTPEHNPNGVLSMSVPKKKKMPPEPPMQNGVLGKGLPANLSGLNTGHFQSKKEKDKKGSKLPHVEIAGLQEVVAVMQSKQGKLENSINSFASEVQKVSSAIKQLETKFNGPALFPVKIGKSMGVMLDDLAGFEGGLHDAMTKPKDFFSED